MSTPSEARPRKHPIQNPEVAADQLRRLRTVERYYVVCAVDVTDAIHVRAIDASTRDYTQATDASNQQRVKWQDVLDIIGHE